MSRSPMMSQLARLFAAANLSRRENLPPEAALQKLDDLRLQRREVLRSMAVGAAVLGTGMASQGCTPSGGTEGNGSSSSGGAAAKKVVVVGAGIAGLHAAYRLKQGGADVHLYEAQDRVGGRMWTSRDRFPGNLQFEIGGELIDSNHATLFALATELGITLDDRWAVERPDMVRETYFLNGARVTAETLLEQTVAVSATLAMQVEAAETDDAAFEMLDNTTLAAWLAEHVPVATHPELHHALRVAFIGEFGLEAEEQSCLNLLYLFGFDSTDEFLIFGDSDERWHTQGGNDLFTTRLAERVGTDRLHTGHVLQSAAGSAEGPFTLVFSRAATSDMVTVTCDHVVFALPFTTLRRVDTTGLALGDDKRALINTLGYGTNAKVMGHFSARPWWDVHNESGLLTTTLGAQQGWDTTLGQQGVTGGVWTNFLGGTRGAQSNAGTDEEAFRLSLPDLETIWPGTAAAFTGTAARMHWPTFEWARGSYTCYTPGQWATWATEGERVGNIHFCGEHCSLDFQGWMEGAAESGKLVADEVLADLQAGGGQPLTSVRARPRWAPRARRLARRAR